MTRFFMITASPWNILCRPILCVCEIALNHKLDLVFLGLTSSFLVYIFSVCCDTLVQGMFHRGEPLIPIDCGKEVIRLF